MWDIVLQMKYEKPINRKHFTFIQTRYVELLCVVRVLKDLISIRACPIRACAKSAHVMLRARKSCYEFSCSATSAQVVLRLRIQYYDCYECPCRCNEDEIRMQSYESSVNASRKAVTIAEIYHVDNGCNEALTIFTLGVNHSHEIPTSNSCVLYICAVVEQ